MARTNAVLGAGARLSDYLSASLLARVYPAELIEQILDEHGVNSQRIRSLPAAVMTYYCMALSLYPEAAYAEVYSVIAHGLAWTRGGVAVPAVANSSISAARGKLGSAPLKALHRRVCLPLADPKRHPHAFYAGLRLVAIDGSNFAVADEPDTATAFGSPGSRTGHAAYPQAQCAVLVECASHAILGANLGAYRTAEWAICEPLLSHVNADMLLLADRGASTGITTGGRPAQPGRNYYGVAPPTGQLPVVRLLPDGSYVSAIYPDPKSRRSREGELALRVIEYSLPDMTGEPVRYRLVTTLLDHQRAPATELASLYHERWEIEGLFDELKTHLHQSRRVLRSKTAEGVRQEFYGWVLAHYAICWLMHRAADTHGVTQRSCPLPGMFGLCAAPSPFPGPFPPERSRVRNRWFSDVLREVATLRCASSRNQSRPRMVKRRHSPYPSYARPRPPSQAIRYTPALLAPMPLTVQQPFAILR